MPLRVGDQCFQLFVLVAFDKTFSRYYVRSASEVDSLGMGWPAQLFDCCC